MATITKQFLSGSTNGRPIEVAATSTAGTTIHTAVSGTTDIDEIWIWASNNDTSSIILTIEFGGTTDQDDRLVTTVAASSTELVVPGLILQNGCIVKAYAGTTNEINLVGYVNRLDY
tara:strand:+ start:2011 stop:2361 length:351 start_codon:yes stop_codon:yes gene_type:complete